jgi:hypothetical protein
MGRLRPEEVTDLFHGKHEIFGFRVELVENQAGWGRSVDGRQRGSSRRFRCRGRSKFGGWFEGSNGLKVIVFENPEVVFGKTGDWIAGLVGDHDAQDNEPSRNLYYRTY